MASLSSAASQIRVLGGTPSPRNVVYKQGSLNSNRVSFGLPPRSSSLTLSSSGIRKPTNGILPVAAVGNGNSYNELERLAVEAAKILVKEVTNMFGGEEQIKEKRSGDVIDKTKNHADFGNDTCRREKLVQLISLFPVDEHDEVRRTTLEKMRVADEVDRVMQEEKRKIAEEAAKKSAAQEIKEKRSGDVDKTAENHGDSSNRTSTYDKLKESVPKAKKDVSKHIVKIFEEFGAEPPADVEPLVELALDYLTTLKDTYAVGDYIKTRIGTDIVEGVVISKDWNVTRLKTLTKEVIAIDNHKLSGWVQIRS